MMCYSSPNFKHTENLVYLLSSNGGHSHTFLSRGVLIKGNELHGCRLSLSNAVGLLHVGNKYIIRVRSMQTDVCAHAHTWLATSKRTARVVDGSIPDIFHADVPPVPISYHHQEKEKEKKNKMEDQSISKKEA